MSDALVITEHLADTLKAACQRCKWMFRDGEMVCRRNPPQSTIMMVPAPPPRAGQMVPMTLAAFPTVHKDMFCGEFRLAAGKMD